MPLDFRGFGGFTFDLVLVDLVCCAGFYVYVMCFRFCFRGFVVLVFVFCCECIAARLVALGG